MRAALRVPVPVPIARGPLRGRWWLPAGGGKVWRVLGGTYEREQSSLFSLALAPGQVVLDLGAHLGYYSLLASLRVGATGRVFSFEPDPHNAWYLRLHARLNGCRNLEVHEAAVYDRAGCLDFRPGRGSGTGRVGDGGGLRVTAVRLDEFVAERGIAPSVVKIDVEGAEARVLGGGREALRRHRPTVFLSTHSPSHRAECERLLRGLEYRMEAIPRRRGEALCTPAERRAALAPLTPVGG